MVRKFTPRNSNRTQFRLQRESCLCNLQMPAGDREQPQAVPPSFRSRASTCFTLVGAGCCSLLLSPHLRHFHGIFHTQNPHRDPRVLVSILLQGHPNKKTPNFRKLLYRHWNIGGLDSLMLMGMLDWSGEAHWIQPEDA